jgi:hypothetical protein
MKICSNCRSIILFEKCLICKDQNDKFVKRSHDGADRKHMWDSRRLSAHRRHGTALKICTCGHHLTDGKCTKSKCECNDKMGCLGGSIAFIKLK